MFGGTPSGSACHMGWNVVDVVGAHGWVAVQLSGGSGPADLGGCVSVEQLMNYYVCYNGY